MHYNGDVFPDSNKLLPKRWLSKDAVQRAAMENRFLAFSKVSRQYVGIKYVFASNVGLIDQSG
jgi:hypothetical protein